MRGYFVTGTDTNAGKTHVTCALATLARSRGYRVAALKPIETGCTLGADGALIGADQQRLAAAAGWPSSFRGLYRYPLPAAPLVAAEQVGRSIDLAQVQAWIRRHEEPDGLLLVEGAGGWRVPITLMADMSTLGRLLGLPILVVARASLGTINHTLLTIEAIQRDGLPVAGVVLSQRADDDPDAAHSNQVQIQRRWNGSVALFRSEPVVLAPFLAAQ